MDARVIFDVQDRRYEAPVEAPAFAPDTPPEATLEMPRQPVAGSRRRVLGETDGHWRLAALLGPALLVTVLATLLCFALMSADGMTPLEWLVLVFFGMNLAWVSSAASTAIAGAVVLMTRKQVKDSLAPFRTNSLTAIIFPIRNEHPGRVMGGAQAVYDALARAGADHAFEIFFLSDTSDPDVARVEEDAFRRLRLARPHGEFFYRRRHNNQGRKAGNVAEFVRRWGKRYDYMAVFDADSLMTAKALIELVQRMDSRPRTALIQTLPSIVNARTLFARTQQFAMRAYGQVFGAGLAWWSGGAGNFWGHNAIIRTQAFAAHAGLPSLGGSGPLGGEIMSHDFVEAALLRRAGWRVEIAPEITGSYEECPPTLASMETRDRRWAQGNLQHMSLIGAPGFDPLSRIHMFAGLMGYLSAPLWFALVTVGVISAWLAPAAETSSGLGGPSAFLFGLTALIVYSPKILALLLWATGKLPGWSRHPRFIAAVAIEAVISAAMAPILMVSQTLAVVATLTGRDAGWGAQTRDAGSESGDGLAARYSVHLAVGLLLGVGVAAHDVGLAAWTAPVAFSLIFAAPISAGLSRLVRRQDRLWRYTATPEDISTPAVVRAAARAALEMGDIPANDMLPRPMRAPILLPVRHLEAPEIVG